MTAATHDNPEVLLGLRIMTLLHRQRKTVYALAKSSGVPLHTVQKICNGESPRPGLWTVAALARALGVTLDSLVALPEPADTTPTAKRQRTYKAAPVA